MLEILWQKEMGFKKRRKVRVAGAQRTGSRTMMLGGWSVSSQIMQDLIALCTGLCSLFQRQEGEAEVVRFLKTSVAS